MSLTQSLKFGDDDLSSPSFGISSLAIEHNCRTAGSKLSSLLITDEMFLIMETHSGLKRLESELSKASITGKKNQVSSHLTTVLQPT